MTQQGPETDEPITVEDRRRIDPETGEVRAGADGPEAAESEGPGGSDGQTDGDAAPEAVADAEPTDGEVAELTAALQRERAQFANFKRRAAEEQQGSVAYGKRVLIEKLLPILDDFDRARAHGDLAEGPLRVFSDKLGEILAGEGLKGFGEPGDVFDPDLHEAVQNDGTSAEPVLGDVYRRGYRVADRVVRTAMVTVTDPVGDNASTEGAQ